MQYEGATFEAIVNIGDGGTPDVAKDAIVIDHGAVLKNEGLEFEYRVIGCGFKPPFAKFVLCFFPFAVYRLSHKHQCVVGHSG